MTKSADATSPADADPRAIYKPPGMAVQVVMLLLAIIGGIITGYLMFASLNASGVAGCGEGSPCDVVLSSKWSKWFGIPVAGLSMAWYTVLALMVLMTSPNMPPRRQALAWMMLKLGAFVLLGAAAWFIYLQYFELKQYCPYCLSAHGVGVVFALLVLILGPFGKVIRDPTDPKRQVAMTGQVSVAIVVLAVVMIGALVAGQLTATPDEPTPVHIDITGLGHNPDTPAKIVYDTGPGPDRIIRPPNSDELLKVRELPLLGSPDAAHIWVEMFDYTCPYCRELAHQLKTIREHYGEQLAVVLTPLPLSHKCNRLMLTTQDMHYNACEYARIALAVWRAKPQSFEAFHHYLFEPYRPPPYADVWQKAAEILGSPDALRKALSDPWIDQAIAQNVELYDDLGRGNIPKMMIENGVFVGRPHDLTRLYQFVEERTALRPQAAE